MTKFTASKLSKILKEHKRWHDTDGEEGEFADLSGVDLSGADLRENNLSRADLRGANLSDANLYANLSGNNLSGADIGKAKGLTVEQLSKVKTLYKAKLDPELMEQVKDKYPHLLKEPVEEEDEE